MKTFRKTLKIAGIVVGVLLGIMVVAAIVVPFVVKIDDYRPKVVQAANDQINGKLELGKLSLSLWGHIKVKIDGFTLTDAKGGKVVSATDVYLHVPVWTVLIGSPEVEFVLREPELFVEKDSKGKLNVLSLVKAAPATAGAAPGAAAPPSNTGMPKLPGIAVRAKLDIDIEKALLSYRDDKQKLSSQVKDLNIKVNDLSLSHPMDMDIWANLDTTLGKTLSVKGPAKIHVDASPKFSGGSFSDASLKAVVTLDDLVIEMPGSFEKKKGTTANASLSATLTPQLFTLENMTANFAAAQFTGLGTVSKLDTNPELNLKFSSNQIPLKPWSELVPMLKEYDLGGSASLEASLTGPLDKVGYGAHLQLTNVTAKSPQLKAQPVINGRVQVVTDKVSQMEISLKAPGNELRMTGSVVSFTKPQIQVQVSSTGMDLDQLINFPKPAAGAAKSQPAAAQTKAGAATDFDRMLDPIRTNPMLSATAATVRFNLDSVKADGVKMTDIVGTMTFKDLAASIQSFRMGVWSGVIAASASVQMRSRTPQYHFQTSVTNLDIKQAVQSQLELFKNTLLGTATFKMEGSGSSFNPDPAKANLNSKGNLLVQNATFATIDIGKMVTDAVNHAVSGVAEKVPALKSINLKPPQSIESKYSSITSDFTTASGVFTAPNFTAKAIANRGIDLKGNTTVNLKSYALNANWQVIDTYNLTGLKDVTVDQGGFRADHVLAEGNNPVQLPVQVTGTVFSPSFNYGAIPAVLAKIALGNLGKAVQNRAKSELQNKAQQTLQGLGKQIFGH